MKGKVQYVVRQLNDEGEVVKEISGTKMIPETIKGQYVKNIQLYLHGEKPGMSPYKSIGLLRIE